MGADANLTQAVAHHLAGRLADAERLYRAVLVADPRNPKAHHNMGVLALQVGRREAALLHFQTAVAANPKQVQYWGSLIEVLIQTGRYDEARLQLAEGRRGVLAGSVGEPLVARVNATPPGDVLRNLRWLEDAESSGGDSLEIPVDCSRGGRAPYLFDFVPHPQTQSVNSGFDTDEWDNKAIDILNSRVYLRVVEGTVSYVRPISELISDILERNGVINIVDFGGGCGQCLDSLVALIDFSRWKDVNYKIIDSERAKRLFERLRHFSSFELSFLTPDGVSTMSEKNPLHFCNCTFDTKLASGKQHCDLIFTNSAIHYCDNPDATLMTLANMSYDYFAISRTLFSKMGPFGGTERIVGGLTPFHVFNKTNVIDDMDAQGSDLFYESIPLPIRDTWLSHDWPSEYKPITNDLLIFKRRARTE